MIHYVVGFAFDAKNEKVLLIKKNRLAWQAGFLNGIGGKIEPGESSRVAMKRECLEETGLDLDWEIRGVMKFPNCKIYIFYAYTDDINNFKQLTNEWLVTAPLKNLKDFKVLPNIPFLVEFGLSSDKPYLILEYQQEGIISFITRFW